MTLSSFSPFRWPVFSFGTLGCVLMLSACGGGGGGSNGNPTPTGTPAPTPMAGTGLLVFAMAPEGADAAQTDIYSARPDGSQLQRLTRSGADNLGNVQPQGSPALSPDRRRIVWVSVRFEGGQSQSQLRIMNADGSGAKVLGSDPNLSGATCPTWSFDGNRIAFSRGNGGIYLVNADGTGVRRLTDRGANPSWNGSNRIAFNAAPGVQTTPLAASRKARGVLPPTTDSYTDIYSIGADGSGLRQLTQQNQTPAGLASINPAWSPDGKTLVFNSVPGSGVPAQLFLIGEDGGSRRLLGNLNGTDAVWSPDGTRIAYEDETGLSVVNRDGSNRSLVPAGDPFFVEDTDWR